MGVEDEGGRALVGSRALSSFLYQYYYYYYLIARFYYYTLFTLLRLSYYFLLLFSFLHYFLYDFFTTVFPSISDFDMLYLSRKSIRTETTSLLSSQGRCHVACTSPSRLGNNLSTTFTR